MQRVSLFLSVESVTLREHDVSLALNYGVKFPSWATTQYIY